MEEQKNHFFLESPDADHRVTKSRPFKLILEISANTTVDLKELAIAAIDDFSPQFPFNNFSMPAHGAWVRKYYGIKEPVNINDFKQNKDETK